MTAGLIAGLALAASPVPEASASPVARHGDLTNRPAGMPATANPAQKLRSASVRQNLAGSSVSGRFTLQASPPASESHRGQHGTLSVNFGNSDSGTCFPDVNHGRFEVALAGDLAGSGFTRSGATYTLSTSSAAAGWSNWDCAYVAVLDSSSTVVDGLVGDLAETHGRPSVAVRSVRLLGSVRQPFPLVRGVWTMLEVELANTGASDARRVVITGNGRGAMVRRTPVGTVSTSTGSTVMVPVRFTGRASRAVVRLRVAGAGTAASRLVRLKRTRFRKPLPGRYRDRAGNVSFRVRNGRIVQFRGKIQSQCGVWPQFTYNTQWWRFPATRVRPDGIVDRVLPRKNLRLDLRMRVAGRQATQGRFYYSSPGGYCHGSRFFTARRVGR